VLALHCAVKDDPNHLGAAAGAGGCGSRSNVAPPLDPSEVKAALVGQRKPV